MHPKPVVNSSRAIQFPVSRNQCIGTVSLYPHFVSDHRNLNARVDLFQEPCGGGQGYSDIGQIFQWAPVLSLIELVAFFTLSALKPALFLGRRGLLILLAASYELIFS